MGRQALLLGYDLEFFAMAFTRTMAGRLVVFDFLNILCLYKFWELYYLCISIISLQKILRRYQMLIFYTNVMERCCKKYPTMTDEERDTLFW